MKIEIFLGVLIVGIALAIEQEGDDPLQWLRDSIPGEPGVDYPIFGSVQETGFSCEGRVFGGYYADVSMGCQAYHVCLFDPLSDSMYPTSFLCPNGTLFQQQIFNCDWWYNVDCALSESYYGLAEGAFGNDGGSSGSSGSGGQCPNVSPLSDDQCFNTVDNCWSPGQSDTDCPNFGLCCFDGCANTCVDGPPSQSGSRPQPQPQPQPLTTPRPFEPFQPQTTTRRPRPIVTQTTSGYDYPVPSVTLPIRPISSTQRPQVITDPPTLYGAPPRRSGRRGRNGRRRGRRLRKRRKLSKQQLSEF